MSCLQKGKWDQGGYDNFHSFLLVIMEIYVYIYIYIYTLIYHLFNNE